MDYEDLSLLDKATCIVDETEEGLDYLRKLVNVFNEYCSDDKAFSIIGQWQIAKEGEVDYQPYPMPKTSDLDNPTTPMA